MRGVFLAIATLGLLFAGADAAMAGPVRSNGGHGGHHSSGNHVYISPGGVGYFNGTGHFAIGTGWSGYCGYPSFYSCPPICYSPTRYFNFSTPGFFTPQADDNYTYPWTWWLGW